MFLLLDSEIVVWKVTTASEEETEEGEQGSGDAGTVPRPPQARPWGPPLPGLGWTGWEMSLEPGAWVQPAGRLVVGPLVCPAVTESPESERPAPSTPRHEERRS